MFEVSAQERRILFGKLLRRFFKRQAFHVADAAFTEGVALCDLQIEQGGERGGGGDGARQVARIDRRDGFAAQSTRRRFGLPVSERGEGRRRVAAEATRGVAFGLTVTDEENARAGVRQSWNLARNALSLNRHAVHLCESLDVLAHRHQTEFCAARVEMPLRRTKRSGAGKRDAKREDAQECDFHFISGLNGDGFGLQFFGLIVCD